MGVNTCVINCSITLSITVGIPSSRAHPFSLGISPLSTGCGFYSLSRICSLILFLCSFPVCMPVIHKKITPAIRDECYSSYTYFYNYSFFTIFSICFITSIKKLSGFPVGSGSSQLSSKVFPI